MKTQPFLGFVLSCAAACLGVAVLASGRACAADLGTVGPAYSIGEPDMLVDLKRVLQAKLRSGELDRIKAEAIARARRRVETPMPVPGLQKVTEARTWQFDPSVRFDDPVLNAEGRVVVPAGALANPLQVVSMSAAWLLFDGRDPAQVALARRQLVAFDRGQRAIKPILVGGSPMQLSKAWQRPVYFDQFGRISKRLGLTAVPALVSQDGLTLRVQEMVAR